MSGAASLRAAMAERRRGLDDATVTAASTAVARRVVQLLAGEPPGRIGAYFASDGEVDPGPAVTSLTAVGWTAWYPVVEPGPPAPMTFGRWDHASPPPPGRFGISSPPASSPRSVARDLTAVLVPLVVFGPGGTRAGRGAGYYDRTFAWLRGEPRPTRPLLVGLGHDFQEDAALAPEPWDVALDVVLTPTRTIRT